MKPTDSTSKKWIDVFLESYVETGNVSLSAKAAGINKSTVYKRRDSDPDFAARLEDARRMAADVLEAEAIRRAVKGVDEPHFYRDKVAGYTRKYSDVLLIFLLKGLKPDVYGDKTRVTGPVVPVQVVEILPADGGPMFRKVDEETTDPAASGTG